MFLYLILLPNFFIFFLNLSCEEGLIFFLKKNLRTKLHNIKVQKLKIKFNEIIK